MLEQKGITNNELARMIADLADSTNRRFNELTDVTNKRFDRVDEKFTHIDEKFASIDEKFEKVNQEFRGVNKRFNELTETIDHLAQITHKEFVKVHEKTDGIKMDLAETKIDLKRDINYLHGSVNLVREEIASNHKDHEARIVRLEEKVGI